MKFTRLFPQQWQDANSDNGFSREVLDDLVGKSAYTSVNEPEVRAITVSTLNGSSTLEGVSGGLGNDLDFQLLLHVRAWADVILVGSSTAVAEKYGSPKLSDELKQERISRGQTPLPALAILTRTVPFEQDSEIFEDQDNPPIFVVPVDLDKVSPTLANKAQKLLTNTDDPSSIITALAELGYRKIALEGGPRVLKSFLIHDCVDVLHLTIDPRVTFPNQHPAFPPCDNETPDKPTANSFALEHAIVTDDNVLFSRYRRAPL